jgi:hypothetical protein
MPRTPPSFQTAAMFALSLLPFAGCGAAPATPGDEDAAEAMIANALSAAPAEIAADARVVLPGPDGMQVLREGSGDFTCFPDNPQAPGNMPMCVDRAGLEWVTAMMMGTEPPAGGPVSVAYMLQGSAFPSFSDPDMAPPADSAAWQRTGPVLMLMNVAGLVGAYPVEGRDVRVPFVMYEGTKWEHLMIPLGAAWR